MSVEQVFARIQQLQSLAQSAVDPAAAPASTAASTPVTGSGAGTSFDAALATAQVSPLAALLQDGSPASDPTADPASSLDPSALLGSSPLPGASGLAYPSSTALGSPLSLGALAQLYGGLSPLAGVSGLPQPQTAAGADVGQRVLAAAESQVGQSEQPPGSNDGPAIALYRSAVAGAQPGEPWCAYFASWAAAQGGAPLGDAGQGFGSVADLTDWAARTGRLLPAGSTPSPGDLILFGDRHVGIVEQVNPDGSLETVEGNYANAVTRVRRSPSEATGYVRIQP